MCECQLTLKKELEFEKVKRKKKRNERCQVTNDLTGTSPTMFHIKVYQCIPKSEGDDVPRIYFTKVSGQCFAQSDRFENCYTYAPLNAISEDINDSYL